MAVNCVNPWLPQAQVRRPRRCGRRSSATAPSQLRGSTPAVDTTVQRAQRISASRRLPGLQHRPAAQPAPPSEALRIFAQTICPKGIPPEQVSRMITQNPPGLPATQNVQIWMAGALGRHTADARPELGGYLKPSPSPSPSTLHLTRTSAALTCS